jgi:hypothetical protein
MSDHGDRETQPEGRSTSRRKFLQTLAGAVAGSLVAGDALAQIRVRQGGPNIAVPGQLNTQLPRLLTVARRGFNPTGSQPLPSFNERHGDVDTPPDMGALIVLAPPAYDTATEGVWPYLYPCRFFEEWDEGAAGWLGAGQLAAMKMPTLDWLNSTLLQPKRMSVATVWNKGQHPAYGVTLRGLCFTMVRESPTKWTEVGRADLGYLSLGAVPPANYLEVAVPVTTLYEGLRKLEDGFIAADPDCRKYPTVQHCLKYFAFDPITDPLPLKSPLTAADDGFYWVGGRQGCGWRWAPPVQSAGSARTRIFQPKKKKIGGSTP